jgi:cell cycle checkpoint protein
VLIEDLPNILHPAVRTRFHDALQTHVERASDVAPVAIVVSAAGVRAEGDSDGSRVRDLFMDARTVVPPGLSAVLVSEIRFAVFSLPLLCSLLRPTGMHRFNPIAPTLLTAAVKRVTALANVRLSPSILHSIVDGAGGDVRSAIMTLEFTCARPTSRKQSSRDR